MIQGKKFLLVLAFIILSTPFAAHALGQLVTPGLRFPVGGSFSCVYIPILNIFFEWGDECPEPTATLTANPSTINEGDSSDLMWTSSDATACYGDNFSTNDNRAGSTEVSPSATTAYSVTCVRDTHVATSVAIVTVVPDTPLSEEVPPAGGGSLCQDGIDNDGDGLIDYPADSGCVSPQHDTEASQCEDGIDNDGNGLVDFPNDPSCSSFDDASENAGAGSGGSSSVLTFSAAPPVVRSGDSTVLSYNVEDASNCSISGTNGDSWAVGTSGTQTSSALVEETTFTLTCTDESDNTVSETVSVRLLPSFEEI